MNSNNKTSESIPQKPIRILPGIIIAFLQWVLWFVIPKLSSGGTAIAISVFGGLACGLFIIIWWAFFSRAIRYERWTAIILMILALIVIPRFAHESIETGLSGLMFFVYAVPTLGIAFVVWALVSLRFSKKLRLITMILTIIFACGVWTLVRSEGITGQANAELAFRWAKTNEEKLLAQTSDVSFEQASKTELDANWSGFRGPNRNGIVHGVKIETDWKSSPPIEIWRKPIGPGCSSFAVRNGLIYTQEQRGENEMVSCYNITSGKPVWRHSDKARFWDSHAGAGPRGTPTLSDSLVFTLGATGIVNALNAYDGTMIWSRNALEDVKGEIPGWGIASSPLVVDSNVIVAVSGKLAAYDITSGKPSWFGPEGGESYSSPQLFTINNIKQVLMMSDTATRSFNPSNGKIIWERYWELGSIVQPAMLANGDLLISEGYKKGIHRITVSNNSGDWNIEERWTTTKIRPDFNDFVIHKNHIYGFEGQSITCIDVKDGKRKWKEGRYGGQLLLLADQNILLVLTEKGELMLVEASPNQFTELAKTSAIEGKTWNHPVLVNDILLVRNTQEMAAFKLL